MNYDVSKENLSTLNIAFDSCKEVPLDIDFTLPDYCPDIQKILKCSVKPHITSRNISGGQISIEGNAEIKIIYIDSSSTTIRCCENSTVFSTSLDMKNTPENALPLTFAKTEYINCRAVSPRKIDLHGALSVCAKVFEKHNTEISSSVNGQDIEQKISKISLSNLIGMGGQQFSINETLEVSENQPSPEMIVNSEVIFLSDKPKIMQNKIVIKGTLIIKIFYISDMEAGSTEKIEYKIPVSQIVDVTGIHDECECITKVEILEHKISIPNDSENNQNLISVNIRCAATALAFCPKEINTVTDVYSRKYETQNTYVPLEIQKILKNFSETLNIQESTEIPNTDIKEIINITPSISNVKTSLSDENISVKGTLKLDILGINSEDIPFYSERTVDFEKKLSEILDGENIQFETELIPTEFKIISQNGNQINFSVNLIAAITAYSTRKINMVTDVNADENLPTENCHSPSVTVYFANKNESVWDIARKYRSSVGSIKEENNLPADVLEDAQMILVPAK